MTDTPQQAQQPLQPYQLPFVAPCENLSLLASWGWLRLGWKGFLAVPSTPLAQ